MAFESVAALLRAAETEKKPLWETVLEDDVRERGCGREDSLRRMGALWQAMKDAAASYDGSLRSPSGLSGGDGARMAGYASTGGIGGNFLCEIVAEALKMGESNACMKRIVAAPTAGACGVLPAVLLPFSRRGDLSDGQVVRALYVAAGFGQVIATRASIAGAEGGCQAEIGSASAMAAAALVFLRGSDASMCAEACAMALQNLMGLVCDPVAGLVEIPCVRRNVVGAVNAVSCADMALAGLRGRIPPDEVIDAMHSVGEMLPAALRETSGGGLAETPTGRKIREMLEENDAPLPNSGAGGLAPED